LSDLLNWILIGAAAFVAFTNGANANFKGVASLYGSGTTSLKMALVWGTLTTFAGSVAATFLASGMLKTFSGRGIVPDGLAQLPIFAASVGIGGAATSFLATRFGFPVSTTHALVGALFGAGLASGQEGVKWPAMLYQFLLPLLVSPLLSICLGMTLMAVLKNSALRLEERSRTLDVLHFMSCGAASFARGLNDTPKIAALLLLAPGFSTHTCILFVGIGIAIGALLDAEGVAETLGKKVTEMNAGQGFVASLVTAGLVATASLHSMPVSTTHVSVGSLLGIGTITGGAKWRKATEILLAWVCTVPTGALLAAIAYRLLLSF
jgi:inorganic phosphate transporter, PiT family